MQQSLLISSIGHFSFLFIMIFSGWGLNKQMDPLPKPVQVSVISTAELDAKLSVAPDLIFKTLPTKHKIIAEDIKSPKIEIKGSTPTLIDASEKLELKVRDKTFVTDIETKPVKLEQTNIVSLKEPKKIELPNIRAAEEKEGNEKASFAPPAISKPNPRTADRIDKVAVSKSSSEKVVEKPKKAVKAADDALKAQAISKAEAPKEASTKITPEGKKNVPIVVSGAIKESSPPPSRPKPASQVISPPVKRPKASELLKKNKQSNQIEMLLAQVESIEDQVAPEVSIYEKNSMMSAIAQKLAKYWEQGILAGNSNFEKYVVKVEVEVNSLGEIIGGVKPLVPRIPKGRYLIAFRQASNALISAATLPIIPDRYPSGITFEITFDPEEGFSF